jgi:hypothetical protein
MSVPRFRLQFGKRRVGIALLGDVELGDFREMNSGDTNLVIAVPLLLFAIGTAGHNSGRGR